MMVRRIARPLFAAVVVADGVDVLRSPEPHVARARKAYEDARARTDLPALDQAQLRTAVRAHGGATAAAGVLLALGKAPRAAALALAVLTVPLVVTEKLAGSDEPRRLLERLSRVGAALLLAADTAGRPGMAWRVRHARLDKAAAREARRAVAAAASEARTTARALRKATT